MQPLRTVAQEPLSISRQVLREYAAVMTRAQSWSKPLSLAEAMADVAALASQLDVLEDGPAVWNQLLQLSRVYTIAGKQVHDANIVATMCAHGEMRLLTFNAGDFWRFSGLIEVIAL